MNGSTRDRWLPGATMVPTVSRVRGESIQTVVRARQVSGNGALMPALRGSQTVPKGQSMWSGPRLVPGSRISGVVQATR